MARDSFFIAGNPQKQLDKLNVKQLRAFTRVSAGVLNTQAFTARTGFQETLTKDNTIRTPTLLRRLMRVKTVKPNIPITAQRAQAGSIKIDGHDGWAAIDQGTQTRATLFTDSGRSGDSNEGSPRTTSKAGKNKTQMKDFRLSGRGDDRIENYLFEIRSDSKRRRKTFYLPRRYKGMRRGIYKFSGGSVGRKGKEKGLLIGAELERMSTPKQGFSPKKTNWSARTIKREINNRFIRKVWRDQMRRELGKIKRK